MSQIEVALREKGYDMDALQFINSRDIRKHLAKLEYKFNSMEASWLVYQCRSATFEEKYAAWRDIIETMPDCPVTVSSKKKVVRESLHAFLREYMTKEDEWKQRFYSDESGVLYQFESKNRGHWYEDRRMFSAFDDCLSYIKNRAVSEHDEIFRIIKRYPADGETSYEALIKPDGTLLSIDYHGDDDDMASWGSASFDRFWFAFPTPFQEGDVIWGPESGDGFCTGPFVMSDIVKPGGDHRYADSSDMNAWGYFQFEESGNIYHESMWNYMDCEYYREELNGKRRVLKALSSYLNREIDISLFANAYHQILSEEYAKDCLPKLYTDEGMRLAGLEKPGADETKENE